MSGGTRDESQDIGSVQLKSGQLRAMSHLTIPPFGGIHSIIVLACDYHL